MAYKDKSDEFLERIANSLETLEQVAIRRFEFDTQQTFTKEVPNVAKSKGKAHKTS